MRAFSSTLLSVALLTASTGAWAFPGVLIAKDDAARSVRATSIVLMQHGGYSIVTVMTEIEGPLLPFALLLPVPADVTASRLRTVRRGILARVESVTAPRLHAFYEQDPCDDGPVEQAWDEHIKAVGRGFLTPEGVPPGDRRYAVSNAISKPVDAKFKEQESELSYQLLDARTPERLVAELARRGYHSAGAALAPLASSLAAGKKLLLAEVSLARVELGTGARIRLGGIRYWSREAVSSLAESVGPRAPNGREDLFLYVFDRKSRYSVQGAPNVVLPTNVVVEPPAADQLASVYAGLLEAAFDKEPGAFALEYAWPTSGCGEPCPDAPLGADELMTLGGDVLEASTTSAAERAPEPGPEPERERHRFEQHLAELMPAERPRAEREHAAERREIARRNALSLRQTYVLTRLHQSRPASVPPRDVELAPAPPISGGVGIPRGRSGELPTGSAPASENRLQMRFVALHAWSRGVECASPRRGAWGKRWASEARQARAVPLALDLAGARPDRRLVEGVLVRPLPELALREHPGAPASAAPLASARPAPSVAPTPHRGCALGRAGGGNWFAAAALALVTFGAGRRRARRPVSRLRGTSRAEDRRGRRPTSWSPRCRPGCRDHRRRARRRCPSRRHR
jgi:hypothetical protein